MEYVLYIVYPLSIILTIILLFKNKNKIITYFSLVYILSFILIFTPYYIFGQILFGIVCLFSFLHLFSNSDKISGKLIHSFIFLPIFLDILLHIADFKYADRFSIILITSISGFAWLIYEHKKYKKFSAVYFIPAAYVICTLIALV